MRVAFVALALAALVTSASAADLFAGSWKIVPEKSKNNWGQKPAQSLTRTYASNASGGYDVKIDGTDADGKPISDTLQAANDVERSVTNSTQQVVKALGATHVKSHRVNASTIVATYYKDGKAVGTSTSTVSEDGHTLTMKLAGTSTDGKKLTGVSVYEKQ